MIIIRKLFSEDYKIISKINKLSKEELEELLKTSENANEIAAIHRKLNGTLPDPNKKSRKLTVTCLGLHKKS